jgi:hypothetical protein
MKRLIEKGLMFGNLIPVDSPALVDRYNRALKHLTGKTTSLTDFHIDLSGYSPEVGDDLGDQAYLNHDGANRQFILLTTAQKTAPLLNARFSTSRPILRRWIELNEPALFALTAKDVVAGELVGSVYDISTPARLFDMHRVTVEADTVGGHVANARELAARIDTFRSKPDAWWDDVLIAEMIGLARETGDVTRHPVDLKPLTVDKGNFWTSHFGGLYIFRNVPHPGVISCGGTATLGPLPVDRIIPLADRNRVAAFLEANGLVEPIVKARNTDAALILQQKIDFILVDAAATLGLDPDQIARRDLRRLAQTLGSALPAEVAALQALIRWIEGGGTWPQITSDHPAYFYTLRAGPHADRDLVNMLLAELTPLDLRQMFICHKELFYASYRGWPDLKRRFAADFLAAEYAVDKAGARAALFGPEPGMDDAAPAPPSPRRDIVDLVGPWGAVRPAADARTTAAKPDPKQAAKPGRNWPAPGPGPWGSRR